MHANREAANSRAQPDPALGIVLLSKLCLAAYNEGFSIGYADEFKGERWLVNPIPQE